MNNFTDQYQNIPDEDPFYGLALALWCLYDLQTEMYDQSVCSGVNERGVAIPMSPYEATSININAKNQRRQLLKMADDWNIPPDVLRSAKQERLHFSDLNRKYYLGRIKLFMAQISGKQTEDADK